ncbi:hypothetical protein L917_03669, partial [Phytophthora nicotianae]
AHQRQKKADHQLKSTPLGLPDRLLEYLPLHFIAVRHCES